MPRLVLLILILAAAAAVPAAAETLASDPGPGRIRTADTRLETLLRQGVARSATFRALVERLEGSDVVVYLRQEHERHAAVAGRLVFVTAAAGQRYVLIRLTHTRPRLHHIALLAHELQHAVEVADTPAIVDAASFAREYARIGHTAHGGGTLGRAYDTQAALDVGRQVLRELDD